AGDADRRPVRAAAERALPRGRGLRSRRGRADVRAAVAVSRTAARFRAAPRRLQPAGQRRAAREARRHPGSGGGEAGRRFGELIYAQGFRDSAIAEMAQKKRRQRKNTVSLFLPDVATGHDLYWCAPVVREACVSSGVRAGADPVPQTCSHTSAQMEKSMAKHHSKLTAINCLGALFALQLATVGCGEMQEGDVV